MHSIINIPQHPVLDIFLTIFQWSIQKVHARVFAHAHSSITEVNVQKTAGGHEREMTK